MKLVCYYCIKSSFPTLGIEVTLLSGHHASVPLPSSSPAPLRNRESKQLLRDRLHESSYIIHAKYFFVEVTATKYKFNLKPTGSTALFDPPLSYCSGSRYLYIV